MKIRLIAYLIITINAASSYASEKLSQKQVIDSATKNYPKILSYYDMVDAADGSLLSSMGFFDIKLKQEVYAKTRGFYDGTTTDTLLEKELGTMGAKIYGGYRKSSGSFANYDGNYQTASGGEYRIGANLSLLRNRSIDKNRLGVILSKLDAKESKIQLEAIKKEIERDARKAYWKWVSAAKIFQIYKDLYELSLARHSQLEERLEKGDVAKIIVVENKKNILHRKNSMIEAIQNLKNSAIYLSLFFRDELGNPIVPKQDQTPEIKINTHQIKNEKLEEDLIGALQKRPEIRIIKIKKEESSNKLEYSKNILEPQLDIDIGASKDVGNGTQSISQSNNYAGLKLSIPLQQREAKGMIAKYQSEISAIKYEEKLIKDQVKAELSQIQNNINSLVEIYQNVSEESDLAHLLEKAEREKFKQGASNFFLVNWREQDAAITKVLLIEAFEKYQNALADYKLAAFLDHDE